MTLRKRTSHRAAGALLAASFVIATLAAGMYSAETRPGAFIPSFTYLVWERGLFVAAAAVAAVGFCVLLWRVSGSAGSLFAPSGVSAYVVGVMFLLTAETLKLSQGGARWPLIVTYVVLACLAQAAIGGALVLTRLVAPWIGWATIAWNVVGLAVLLIVGDIYIPIFHHVMPLVIGIPLLWRG